MTKFFKVEEMLNLKIEKEGLHSLSEEELDFLSIEELQREVNHGGFSHFLFYAHDYVISQVYSALIRIGAEQTACIVKEVFEVFKNGMPPEDIDLRQEILDSDNEELENHLDNQYDKFLKYEDNLDRLLYDYCSKNLSYFNI